MTTPLRSVRLAGRAASGFARTTGTSGEIFYDSTNNTIRVCDGRVAGGNILADREWVIHNSPPDVANIARVVFRKRTSAGANQVLLPTNADLTSSSNVNVFIKPS